MSKNKFLIDKYDKLMVDIKMYMCEISKFKISDLKPKKMTILWTPTMAVYRIAIVLGTVSWSI